MEVGGVVVSLLFAAFSLPCLLLLLVLAEAGLRLASLAIRGGRLSWPSRSAFLRYRVSRSSSSSAAVTAGVGTMEEDSTLPVPAAEWCERLAVAVYRRGRGDDAAAVDCVFCLTRVDDGEEVRELRCRHVFHRACLDAWLVRPRATCPLCRDCLLPPSPPPTPPPPPRDFPLDYYHDDDDVHFGFNDFSITSSSSAAVTGGYHHGVAFWPM